MGTPAFGLLLVAALVFAGSAVAADVARLLDASADRVVAFTPVPDAARKVGETRLVARGDAVVVQTLLSTKLLSRVVAEIREKEERNWPEERSGVEGRRAYVEALVAAREALDKRSPGPDWTDRRQRLLVEFAADATGSAVVIGTFDAMPATGEPGPRVREVLATLDPPRAYVLRNIRLVVADSFGVDEKDADRIGPLGPAASPKDAAP
jgi:hypothetical protein